MRTTPRTPFLHRALAPCFMALLLLGVAACGGSDGTDGAPGTDGADGAPGSQTIFLRQIGRFHHTDQSPGAWGESAAEIVAFDAASERLFVVNGMDSRVDILDASDPTMLSSLGSLDLSNGGAFADFGAPNSCATSGGNVAVAVENDDKQANGWIYFFSAATGAFIARKDAGALPDMVTFTHDGTKALAANEGEPNDDYTNDPEGTITVIDISGGIAGAVPVQIDFNAFDAQRASLIADGVRIFGQFGQTALPVASVVDANPGEITTGAPHGMSVGEWFTLGSSTGDPIPYQVGFVIDATSFELTDEFDGDSDVGAATLTVYRHDGMSSVSQDVEPEYIAVSGDNTTAYVTLQENNAVAIVDLTTNTVTAIAPLGVKDHMIPGNEIDGSDRDGIDGDPGVGIASRPVYGMYMPDSIAAYTVNGETYLITANEGDAREYGSFVEEVRFKDVAIDPNASTADPSVYDTDSLLGRLATSLVNDTDGDGDLDQVHCFGARSFTIWSSTGTKLWDSGSQFGVVTANRFGLAFNNDNDETDGDSRSDAKGCEPEACTVGQVGESWYAFIGLERMGGIMVYDVTQPSSPKYVMYTTNRDVTVQSEDFGDPDGDYGPEGFTFVAAADSPTGKPLLVVASEISGTTTVYEIDQVPTSSKFQAELILR